MILIATAALFGPVMGVKSLAIGFPSAYIAALPVRACVEALSFLAFVLRPLDESAKKVLLMAAPIVLGSVFTQVYMLTNLLASRLAEGSVAALSFADRLRQFPLGFFAMAVTTVIFPTLSGMWSKGDREGFKSTAVNGIRFVEFVCIPAAVGLMVLAKPIVRLVFERGAFVPEHTAAVASALTAYSPALAGMAALSVISFVFYASQETRVPVALAVGTALLNVALDVILVGPLGHVGLALANSVSQTVGALVGVYLLNRLLRDLPLRSLSNSLIKVLVSSAVMGAAAFELSRYSGFHGGTGNVLRDLLTGGIVMGAAVVYVHGGSLKAEETQMLIGLTRTGATAIPVPERSSQRCEGSISRKRGETALRKIASSDLLSMKWVSGPEISPDGEKLLYTVRSIVEEDKDKKYKSHLCMARGGKVFRFTSGPKNDTSPRWSPKGDRIAFMSERGKDRTQLFLISADGGEAVQLTNRKEGVGEPVWSPDG